jgi:hypothetical protein
VDDPSHPVVITVADAPALDGFTAVDTAARAVTLLPSVFADAGLRDPIVRAETMTSADGLRPSMPPSTTMAADARPTRPLRESCPTT